MEGVRWERFCGFELNRNSAACKVSLSPFKFRTSLGFFFVNNFRAKSCKYLKYGSVIKVDGFIKEFLC